ncbi:phage baseplate protein [Sorangium sp. So ce131]|uniref:T4 family baseplate hub assembly chaperone n=1 Tax=Sorangium sp. So ce131 TaxID=3133282 RepID=UPI003F63B145
MRVPDAHELLDAWERGLNQPPVVRALLLLAGACPDETFDELSELPLGERDRRLLDLRERLFGPQLTATVTCPACGERLEAGLTVADIRLRPDDAASLANDLEVDGHRIVFRVPTSGDLLAVVGASRSERHARLLQRCLIEIRGAGGEALRVDALPAPVRQALSARMAAADPQADVQLRFTCSGCQHGWGARFDVAMFLWQELDAWAQRLLRDVTCLARAFGWREADVLSLSPTRRQIYMELCQA